MKTTIRYLLSNLIFVFLLSMGFVLPVLAGKVLHLFGSSPFFDITPEDKFEAYLLLWMDGMVILCLLLLAYAFISAIKLIEEEILKFKK